ncbi:unnamed protein product [Eruca vesicaria subsp. sativa]|uniref:Uncharacterized protein n=1 Tax=Eruca vesicaria subsp. sativa TaxID=29727 RepID=A0ABC8LCA8_ERUVS|nr:unnamed protein product [Eruca vesicaria subsp. sativa]
MKALVSAHLLRNRDSDVRVYVVSCLTEIMRITAPEAPYNDDQMKEIFKVIVRAFGKLADTTCHTYEKAVTVLDTVSRVRLSLVMLDLECDDLILKMFRQFLKVIRPDHPESVLLSMEAIMVTVIHGSEEVPMDLLEILLSAVKRESQVVSPMASWLVEKVIISCACKLQPCIMDALKSTGTSLDMYSPVVLATCQGEAETYIVVKPKQVEGKLDFRLSHKGDMSKSIARCGTQAHGDEKVRGGDDLKQLLNQVQSENSAETESGSTRRRRRKINSLMSPEGGYSFKTLSSKKVQEKEFGDSSLGKLAAKKAYFPSKVALTNQSVVSSLTPSSKDMKGSRKRSRSKVEGCLPTLPSKKQTVKKENPEEEDYMESDLKKLENSIKTTKSSKKERAQNGSAKAFAKKPLAESKRVETSGKKSAHSESKGASMDPHIRHSSKSKKKISHATTPSTKESGQTAKGHPKRKRAAGEEVESHKSELGEELVGLRMKVWWPLDKKFYEGVIKSYCSRKKRHEVSYTDGDVENLDLNKERWEIIQNSDEKEIDLPDSTLLSEIRRRERAKKSKHVSKNVELSTSANVRSSKKKDHVSNSTKQEKRTKGLLKCVSNEPESREDQNLKSSKEPDAETRRTKGRVEKWRRVTRSMHRESEKDSNAEPECRRGHQELPDDSNAETKADGAEHKEPAADTKAVGEERDYVKEPPADTKVIEEDMCEESHRDVYTSVPETGKVENEVDQKVVKELIKQVGSVRVLV